VRNMKNISLVIILVFIQPLADIFLLVALSNGKVWQYFPVLQQFNMLIVVGAFVALSGLMSLTHQILIQFLSHNVAKEIGSKNIENYLYQYRNPPLTTITLIENVRLADQFLVPLALATSKLIFTIVAFGYLITIYGKVLGLIVILIVSVLLAYYSVVRVVLESANEVLKKGLDERSVVIDDISNNRDDIISYQYVEAIQGLYENAYDKITKSFVKVVAATQAPKFFIETSVVIALAYVSMDPTLSAEIFDESMLTALAFAGLRILPGLQNSLHLLGKAYANRSSLRSLSYHD
jgi:ABC-type bacteriocin/lantibiotic exporter with double-glycine peptidase domain